MKFTAEQYVDDVLGGQVKACQWVRLACERHRKDLDTGQERGLFFDETAAKLAVVFFGILRHWKGEWAGKPVTLEPWQQFATWSAFGWKRTDGLRRFRTVYLEVARKNGKTTWAGGTGLFLMEADGEPGAEIYSAATKREQARISHRDATEMVRQSKPLQKTIQIYKDNLHSLATRSKFEPLGRDANSTDGLNIHGVIADEVHAWKDRDLWDKLETATGSRRQPLMLAITTAGYDRQSLCWQLHEYAEKVALGLIEDDSFFGLIYTLDKGDDWEDEGNWIKSNPNLGVSKKWDDIRRKAARAKEMPAALNAFLRLELNLWTQAESRWIDPVKWQACGDRELPSLVGRVCYGGLDLSKTLDLTSIVWVFPPAKEGEPWWVLPRFWVPEDNVTERVKRDRVPYDVWIRQGLIEPTPGNVVDYDFIEYQIREDAKRFKIKEIAFDPWNATSVSNHLIDDGLNLVEFRQGFITFNPAMKALEVAIQQRLIAHGGNPVLAWMADNLVVRMDPAGNMKPDKEKSTEKIDGIVALIMAYHRATLAGGQAESVYKTRGIRTL